MISLMLDLFYNEKLFTKCFLQDLSETEYNTLKDLYVEKNIILNVISKYNILKYKGLVGLNWNHRIISLSSILDETRELPQVSVNNYHRLV
jgi:hypothetical protein